MPRPAGDRTLHAYVRPSPIVRFILRHEEDNSTIELVAIVETNVVDSLLGPEHRKQIEQMLAVRLAELFEQHGWGDEK